MPEGVVNENLQHPHIDMHLQLNRRPLCVFCAVFLFSFYIAGLFYSDLKLFVATIIVGTFVVSAFSAFCFFKDNPKAKRFFIFHLFTLSVALALTLSYFVFDVSYLRKVERLTGTHTIEAIITEKSYDNEYSVYYNAVIVSCDGQPCNVRTTFVTNFESDFKTEDKIISVAKITPSNDGMNLADRYDLSKGIICRAVCSDEENSVLVGHDTYFPYTHISKLRSYISSSLEKYLDDNSLALSKAVIYGDKSLLSPQTKEAFAELGISHTLAISGLHLGIVIALITFVTRLFRISKPKRSFAVIIIGLIFVFITGLTPSVCRAYLMFSILVLSGLFRRKRDLPTTLLLAVTLICIISPASIYDIGLHLSFFSTLGIITFALPINSIITERIAYRIPKYVLSLCVMTICANLFTFPYSFLYFGSISLIAPIANLIFIPLITLLVYTAPLIAVFSFLPPVAASLSYPVKGLCFLINYLCNGSLRFTKHFLLPLDSDFARICGIISVLGIVLLMIFSAKKIPVFIIFALYIVAVVGFLTVSSVVSYPKRQIYHFTDGRSDMVVLKSENRAVLIENSYLSHRFVSDCIDNIQSDAVTSVDALVLTHFHNNTISTLQRILNSYPDINSVTVFMQYNPTPDDMNTFDMIKQVSEQHQITLIELTYSESALYREFNISVTARMNDSEHPDIGIQIEENDLRFVFASEHIINNRNDNSSQCVVTKHSNQIPNNADLGSAESFCVYSND